MDTHRPSLLVGGSQSFKDTLDESKFTTKCASSEEGTSVETNDLRGHAARSPHIQALIVGLISKQNFHRAVASRANIQKLLMGWLGRFIVSGPGYSEVGDESWSRARFENEIRWLDVAMNDSLSVDEGDAFEHVGDEAALIIERERSVLKTLFEIVLHARSYNYEFASSQLEGLD